MAECAYRLRQVEDILLESSELKLPRRFKEILTREIGRERNRSFWLRDRGDYLANDCYAHFTNSKGTLKMKKTMNELVARDASGEITNAATKDLALTFYVTGMTAYDLARHAGRTHCESIWAARHELWLLKSEFTLTDESWGKVFQILFVLVSQDKRSYKIFVEEVAK